jgi:hypothetical protein
MAVSSNAFVQQPTSRMLPVLTGAPRVAPIDDTTDTPRPIVSADSTGEGSFLSSDPSATVLPFTPEFRRRQNGPANATGYRPSANPDFTPRPIFNPRGAPSDAVPAMSQLEARIAFEPVFMQHYASTLYALVSRIPTTLAERRQAFDLLA